MDYATIEDLKLLWRPMTNAEEERATAYLKIVSNELRIKADAVGKDLDQMMDEKPTLKDVAKSVVCDVVARIMQTSTENEPMTTYTQTANGYSMSGTYLVPGGGVFIKKSELARLGLRRQRFGTIEHSWGINRND